jgi:hypothetical protein
MWLYYYLTVVKSMVYAIIGRETGLPPRKRAGRGPDRGFSVDGKLYESFLPCPGVI